MDEALTVKCPKCGARIGEQCQRAPGGLLNWLGKGNEHVARKRAAAKAKLPTGDSDASR